MNSAVRLAKDIAAQMERISAPLLEEQKRRERMMAPHLAEIERASRRLEKQHLRMRKIVEAAMPDFLRVHAILEEERKRFPDQVRTLAKHGWYMPPDISPRAVREITDALAGGRAADVEATMIEYYDGQLNTIEASLCKQAPARERHLRSALAAHRRGDYAAAIPLMLAQADGLCRDFTGNHLFSGRDKFAAQFKNAPPFVQSLLIAVLETMPVAENEKQRAGKMGLFNRHAIMHGESVDYDSAANSSRAISLLVYVAWALGELPRPIAKDKRADGAGH